MAFPNQKVRLLTRQNIEQIKSGTNGVYGIFALNQWVYVGKGDIKARLFAHINADNPCILRYSPLYWVDEVSNDPLMSQREKQLILELNPACNKKIG